MAIVEHRRPAKLPHPRRRIPLLGDVLAFDADIPSQSAMALAALGPVVEFRFLGARYVVAGGSDAV
ncbi:MAG TPA: cytochrome P450, partial [Mycobacterium sp.]|nr:cytochrome P450 [Mycobacterium sp.]